MGDDDARSELRKKSRTGEESSPDKPIRCGIGVASEMNVSKRRPVFRRSAHRTRVGGGVAQQACSSEHPGSHSG